MYKNLISAQWSQIFTILKIKSQPNNTVEGIEFPPQCYLAVTIIFVFLERLLSATNDLIAEPYLGATKKSC